MLKQILAIVSFLVQNGTVTEVKPVCNATSQLCHIEQATADGSKCYAWGHGAMFFTLCGRP